MLFRSYGCFAADDVVKIIEISSIEIPQRFDNRPVRLQDIHGLGVSRSLVPPSSRFHKPFGNISVIYIPKHCDDNSLPRKMRRFVRIHRVKRYPNNLCHMNREIVSEIIGLRLPLNYSADTVEDYYTNEFDLGYTKQECKTPTNTLITDGKDTMYYVDVGLPKLRVSHLYESQLQTLMKARAHPTFMHKYPFGKFIEYDGGYAYQSFNLSVDVVSKKTFKDINRIGGLVIEIGRAHV